MSRTIRQTLPDPPPVYDQAYIAKLVNAVNNYMVQKEAQGELVTARLILTDTLRVPADVPNVATLPTGTVYLVSTNNITTGMWLLTVVNPGDPA